MDIKLTNNQLQYYIGAVKDGFKLQVPNSKRIPFGWKAVPILDTEFDHPLKLLWSENPRIDDTVRFRITIALDVREEKLIEVFLINSGQVIGEFDIRYAHVFEIFEIEIEVEYALKALKEGIGLRMTKGSQPLWIFSNSNPKADKLFLPHILITKETDKLQEFYKRMFSLASVQPFGWMEGCVLDGLMDLGDEVLKEKAYDTIKKHISLFFDKNNNLKYENPRSEPVDGTVYGIENCLTYAVIAKVYPQHPSLDVVIEYLCSHINNEGSIQDGDMLSAEGSYTVAYPLAVLAKQRNRDDLAKLAIRQLMIAKEKLVDGDKLYLRTFSDNTHSFTNWGRAYSWYMLGLVRTIIELDGSYDVYELKREFERVADLAISFQQKNGLWNCFVDDVSKVADNSCSAGIAAAIALGVKNNILSGRFLIFEDKALKALLSCLTPDGLLTGVAQSNKGGEELQRGDYRVISQMAMGLMAQLIGNKNK
ncbi:glycoside hydrolase family 88 protein [Clostridium bowmanii]|uniref:glycoside hydrolase family 88 protein n=1 Tax=Clostridium bowmanii TaxID=132925 RepID=UPI001C0BB991|nr:glycoside hydrolase family 88 protein [Clostridium bowmanii]MBU3191025.1 glycoside hydrolase family 88 protein [Clostridium bowmanii]MCA1075348.1 glycoside hydrolase family 88 protein [Clostridium bowmanii]